MARLHDAGIEVMLDVVHNHIAEGNHMGPTLSFRIDNASYYWLQPDNCAYYDDFIKAAVRSIFTYPRVMQLVMDSLRYWSRSAMSMASVSISPRRWRGAERVRLQKLAPDRHQARSGAGDRSSRSPNSDSRPRWLSGRRVSLQWPEWNDRYRSAMRATGAAKAARSAKCRAARRHLLRPVPS